MVEKRVNFGNLERRKRVKIEDNFVDDSSNDEDTLDSDKEYLNDQDNYNSSDELDVEISNNKEYYKSNDKDIKIEAFNMKKEFRSGKFNEVGTYIKNVENDNNDSSYSGSEDDEENIEDQILKNVDEESIKKAKIAEDVINEHKLDKNNNKNNLNDINQTLKSLYTLVNKEGDKNAASLMQRLYMKVKKNKKNMKNKRNKSNKDKQDNDDCIDATTRIIEEITKYVAILEPSFVDILWTSREDLSKLLLSSS